MEQTREALTTNLAARWCWQVARREEVRVARRLYPKPLGDGVYPWDAGAVREECFHCRRELGIADWLEDVRGQGLKRELGPLVPYVLRYGLQTRFGMERMQALPEWLCSDEASRRVVGFKAHQVRPGVCQRGAAKRPGPRTAGPIGPAALAHHLVKRDWRALEVLVNGVIRALAQAGLFRPKVTGIVDGTELETTAPYEGCGQVTRPRKRTDQPGQGRTIAVTVYGWNVIVLIEARTTLPLAVTVVTIQAHAGRSRRALVTQARAHRAGSARRHTVVCERGFWAGTDRWGLDPHGLLVGVPAKADLAVTADARGLAAARDGCPVGCRVPTVRPRQGMAAWPERLATEVVGMAGLTSADQSGTPAPGGHRTRRDVQANPIHAVVVRKWHGQDCGPGGTPVCLTHASVQQPWAPYDDDEARRLIENGGITERKPPWSLRHPPQQTARAMRVHVVLTLLRFGLATAYRLRCEAVEARTEPVGWQCWRRQLLPQNRDQVIVCVQGYDGIFPMAELVLLLGVKRKDVPPGLGTPQEILAKYRLTSHD